MRLKYQLRGLGIGIILTAALLMIFSDDKDVSAKTDADTVIESAVQEMTQEVKETLVEESAVETETYSEVEQTITESTDDEMHTEMTAAIEETSEVEEESTSEIMEEVSTQEETTEEVVKETEQETSVVKNNDSVVTIKIVSGDDSGTVSRKLQTAGLVENASEYDAYLMQHGYDKKISVGEVRIKVGSSWLEIAEKISGK